MPYKIHTLQISHISQHSPSWNDISTKSNARNSPERPGLKQLFHQQSWNFKSPAHSVCFIDICTSAHSALVPKHMYDMNICKERNKLMVTFFLQKETSSILPYYLDSNSSRENKQNCSLHVTWAMQNTHVPSVPSHPHGWLMGIGFMGCSWSPIN